MAVILRSIFRFTLNSVIFGIAVMVLIALYIAIGSGVPSVREYFEMNELEFFNAWPLKVLMVLLCLNLAVVTLNRIPLTPPRYGVWCIHCGIITLIMGTSLYYHLKVEGKTLIPLGHMVNLFYDSGERALYARVLKGELYGMRPLPALPRFGNYDASHDPQRLHRRSLSGIGSFTPIGLPSGTGNDLQSWLGLSKPVSIDIVGFYSYADVVEDVLNDRASNETGVDVDVQQRKAGENSHFMLRTIDPSAAHQFYGSTELEYRQVSPESLGDIEASVGKLFDLSASIDGKNLARTPLGIGKKVDIGGYGITVESFNPAFPMFGTHEEVQAMTLHIEPPAGKGVKEFWRMILGGRSLQTDFKMDPATTPPFVKGNRQKEPIDKSLVLGFNLSDPAALMPTGSEDKHVFLTTGTKTLIDIHVSMNAASEISDLSAGGEVGLLDGSDVIPATVRRRDHFRVVSHVEPTAKENQNKDQGDSGTKQVAVVRVKCSDFSQDVPVPCDLYAAPDPTILEPMIPWSMGLVQIPGASAPLQLQLGFTCRPMPVAMLLKNFEMVPYAGGMAGGSTMFRDFRSTLELTDADGNRQTAVASLNEPVYYDHGSWIFFQAGYDPDGQSSTIGVGNRPGVIVMLSGCVLIVSGLLYAFYVKPIVIRRMKNAALARSRQTSEMTATKVGAA
jgi:hypothetical protein